MTNMDVAHGQGPNVKAVLNPNAHPYVGQPARLRDEVGVEHAAIFTAVWGEDEDGMPTGGNFVFVSDDSAKTDPYGRQIDRRTSVVRHDLQIAPGLYFEL